LGRIPYAEAYRLQELLVAHVAVEERSGILLLLEHDHVITLGRSAKLHHLLADNKQLESLGVQVLETNRGGSATYHGPGQLVGYPILPVRVFGGDLHRYLRLLEEVLIRALRVFDIEAGRVPGLTGVWVGDRKIAAIGVGVRRWVTMHGFALNVCPDLSYFGLIVPCGISDRSVTSMEHELQAPVQVEDVVPEVARCFSEVFGLEVMMGPAQLEEVYSVR
jgi:lipoyl(octanoyl) transferase